MKISISGLEKYFLKSVTESSSNDFFLLVIYFVTKLCHLLLNIFDYLVNELEPFY